MLWRSFAARACALGILIISPAVAGAQEWNDPRTRALVEQATERRERQIADTALASYHAIAHGYLTFLGQLGEGFTEPPKIVKADELSLEVYWKAPNQSKQWIVGRRDTLLLPTDIQYHRDHLGIVQNNFPNIIRVGEGDEVRDVPHPLSPTGLQEYDFSIRDSLHINLGTRELEVYEVRVRPKNDRAPRTVGAVFIDKESGEVVRMAFSFTRAALIDKELEDVSIVLENGLIEGRFWLPRRQEVEIRRTGTWLDYPVRGIIRGRWEICCYEVNAPLAPQLFAGPEIMLAPQGRKQQIPFVGQILDSLPPDVRAVTDEEVKQVQEEARALVRAQALARSKTVALSARNVSDFVRVNRVEGLAVGTGVSRRLGAGFFVTARGRYGFGDKEVKGRGEVGLRRASGAGVSVSAYRDYRDASDDQERSRVVNSIAAQEFGSDYTDPFDLRGVSLSFQSSTFSAWNASVEAALERHYPLAVNASPASGSYEPTIDAWRMTERRVSLVLDHPTRLTFLGFEAQGRIAGDVISYLPMDSTSYSYMSRFAAIANLERPVGAARIVARSLVASVFGDDSLPAQHLVFLGGPSTGPGYDFHELAGRTGASQRVELRVPAPFPSFSLGRYGRTPASMTLAPFVNTMWINQGSRVRTGQQLPIGVLRPVDYPGTVVHPEGGWYPSVGVGALMLFDVIRLDVARGLRDGRWSFYIDVGRDFWNVL